MELSVLKRAQSMPKWETKSTRCTEQKFTLHKSKIEDEPVILIIAIPTVSSNHYRRDLSWTEFYCGLSLRISLDYSYWTECFGLTCSPGESPRWFDGLSAYCILLFVHEIPCLRLFSCMCSTPNPDKWSQKVTSLSDAKHAARSMLS